MGRRAANMPDMYSQQEQCLVVMTGNAYPNMPSDRDDSKPTSHNPPVQADRNKTRSGVNNRCPEAIEDTIEPHMKSESEPCNAHTH